MNDTPKQIDRAYIRRTIRDEEMRTIQEELRRQREEYRRLEASLAAKTAQAEGLAEALRLMPCGCYFAEGDIVKCSSCAALRQYRGEEK